ncbi:hypothetical protein JCM3765_007069 [Sporobolomyces pararoseus]
MSTFSRSTFNAAKYSASRPHYPPQLYSHVLNYARSGNDNQVLSTLIDIGCGPGLSTFEFSNDFDNKIFGIDPSANMIKVAKSNNLESETQKEKFKFEIGTVENLIEMKGIEKNSIELIVAGQAAHWFNPLKTYSSMYKVLKPGASFVFWGYGEIFFLPKKSNELNKLITKFSHGKDFLGSYWQQPGRSIVENLLKPFPLPLSKNFTTTTTTADTRSEIEFICSQFDPTSFQRSFHLAADQHPDSQVQVNIPPLLHFKAEKELGIKTILHPNLLLTKEWDLKQFENYLKTWSSLHKYREELGRDKADSLIENLLLEMRDLGCWKEGEKVQVGWEVGMLMGKKKK